MFPNTPLHRCGSQYRPSSQQLQNGSPGSPQDSVIFDDDVPYRHISTRKHQAVCGSRTSSCRFTGTLFSTAE
ncbi:hypothetical protein C3Z09_05450 [Lelliottia aquatilis]|nr:hypothetical protein C3Z09_05450 [Lelliottia aquatilis]